MSNKKLFIDLAPEQNWLGFRQARPFKAVGLENIMNAFNKKTSLLYEFLHFRTYISNYGVVDGVG